MQYELIIIGATFRGCGIASASKAQSILVIEPSVVVGSDFALTFNTGKNWDAPLRNKGAQEFKDKLLKRNALTEDGMAATAAFSPMLSEWCIEHNIKIEFSCSVVSQDNNSLKVVGVDGFKEYSAEKIIDATPKPVNGKWLTVLITAPNDTAPGGLGPFIIRKSINPGDFLLSLQIPEDASWSEARAMFHRAWDMRPDKLKTAAITLIGCRFDYRNFHNPALALDAGITEGGAL